jgi:hypothetical protein
VAHGSLAALLSFLVFATSLSASVCGLSCWLHPNHSDCHIIGSAKTGKDDMVMSSDMNMDSDSITTQEVGVNASWEHSIPMSSCAHETCRQAWNSAAPERTLRGHLSSPQGTTIINVIHDDLCIALSRIKIEVSPPEILSADRRTTALRI